MYLSTLKGYLYGIIYISLIFLEGVNTKKSLNKIEDKVFTPAEICGFKYMLMFTKLILLMEAYFISSFYFNKTINTIIQSKVIKMLSIFIWIYLGCRIDFSVGTYLYISLKIISWIILCLIEKEESHIAYHLYNLKISLDLNIIQAFVVSEVIKALKSTALISSVLLLFFDYGIISSDKYSFLFYTKCLVLMIDKSIYNNNIENYYWISLFLLISLSILGILLVTPLVIKEGVRNEPIFIYNELLLISIVGMINYYLYLKKEFFSSTEN